MREKAYLVLESGECYPGRWLGGQPLAGEVVFNTSHSGYEEIATDPSYFSQIMVMTAPMQGNYGVSDLVWESSKVWIRGFVCLEMQKSARDSNWRELLADQGVPVVDEVDTRRLVLQLREKGTMWGALLPAKSEEEAQSQAKELIRLGKEQDGDWVYLVSQSQETEISGNCPHGPKVAVLDFGCKKNILRELQSRCSQVRVFPSRTSAERIREWNPDGILLSNGPGDPALVENAAETVKSLIGWKFIFGICMGHQILGLALGAKTYRLKFGHRGTNHPIRDEILNKVYMTSQNHGYALDAGSMPKDLLVTHVNLNDQTISGIQNLEKKCLSVQFHPESHPGPHDAVGLFDYFIKQLV